MPGNKNICGIRVQQTAKRPPQTAADKASINSSHREVRRWWETLTKAMEEAHGPSVVIQRLAACPLQAGSGQDRDEGGARTHRPQ